MRSVFAAIATATVLAFSTSARAQRLVEIAAPTASPIGAAAVPLGPVPAPLSASALTAFAAPSLRTTVITAAPMPRAALLAAPAASAATLPMPALAAAADGPAPAASLEVPAEAALAPASGVEPEPASAPAGRASLSENASHSIETAAWRFRNLWLVGGRLWDGSRKVEKLGEGVMGSVFVHPSRTDAIVKVAHPGYAETAGSYFGSDAMVLGWEDRDLNSLAELGAAPRTLGALTISEQPASVRERIFGSTVLQLKRRGLFGPRERRLVQEMLERIAHGGFVAGDLHPDNIMIGRRAGDSEDRAWQVDIMGLRKAPELDDAERTAAMLTERAHWINLHYFSLYRPLERQLDGALRTYQAPLGTAGIALEDVPLSWPKPLRYAALAALLAALAVAPALLPLPTALLGAMPSALAHLHAPTALLGILPSWPALAGIAVALTVVGVPLRIFAHRLAPVNIKRSKDVGKEHWSQPPWLVLPKYLIGAAIEETFYRGLLFLGGAAALHAFLPPVAAFAAASLTSSLVFALGHGYGPFWRRVVGGMIYCGALLVSGSLILPIAAHFAHNVWVYARGRYF